VLSFGTACRQLLRAGKRVPGSDRHVLTADVLHLRQRQQHYLQQRYHERRGGLPLRAETFLCHNPRSMVGPYLDPPIHRDRSTHQLRYDQRHLSATDGARVVTRLRQLRRLRGLAGAREGAAATEFAIFLPFFFLLLFGILEFAHACFVLNTLQFAVSQGTRFAMTTEANPPTVNSAGDCTGVTTYESSIQAFLQRQLGAYISSANASVSGGTCTAGSPATVTVNLTVSYDFNFILTALVPFGPITLQQKATVTAPLV
jgi:Flp pilus assembly protein TadG